MPVTFTPATRSCAPDTHPATSRDVTPITAAKILSATSLVCSADADAKARIVRSSIGGRPGPDNTHFKIATGPGNGFVDTVLFAYTHQHALVIRPDDVWLAVVSQFSFYAAAEANSCSFLESASGKVASFALEIPVESDATQPGVAKLSRRMTRLLRKVVPDADLRDWLVPEFSTTTLTDVTVSCLLALSGSCLSSSPTTTQTRSGSDADYTFGASCGIPRVTLEGERADWEILFARLDHLKTRCKDFGLPAVAWYHLLHPILARFIGAFDDPEGVENQEFWGGVAVGKQESNGSGGGSKNAGKLSGWITAFCAFSVEGTWLGPELNTSAAADTLETLTAAEFWSTYTRLAPAPEKTKPKPKAKSKAKAKKTVQLDLNVEPPAPPAPTIVIARADVPPSYASAGLELSFKTKTNVSGDAGTGVDGTATTRERAHTVLAGFSSSRDTELSATGRNDTVRPVVAWWIYKLGGAGAGVNGSRKPKVWQDGKNMEEGSEEHVPVVPAPCVQFDLGPDHDRELDPALVDTAGADGAGATDTQEEPVSTVLAPVQQRDPWSFDLDTPVIPEPPAQPAATTTFFDDPLADVADSGGGGASDANADAGEWNTWSTPAPASKVGFGLGLGFGFGSSVGFGTAPASVDVKPTGETDDGSEAAVKTGKEQVQEQEQQLETKTETPAPAPEDSEPQPEPDAAAAAAAEPDAMAVAEPDAMAAAEPNTAVEPDTAATAETPAAPAGDGEDGDGEDAADDGPTAAPAAKGGAKNNAGGAKGGKNKKKKKGK
ncbi:hypothetical protein B0H16DRAFT_1527153 [Mycena metata]|uniref:Uncharacterized protein n=1 Tax=Mycena metata TaxID=1033252 RepID=A0AAD7JFK3_9AGAR|nr:hypothetical protein B0H16DRAFT_1527153 [Mycena metata]